LILNFLFQSLCFLLLQRYFIQRLLQLIFQIRNDELVVLYLHCQEILIILLLIFTVLWWKILYLQLQIFNSFVQILNCIFMNFILSLDLWVLLDQVFVCVDQNLILILKFLLLSSHLLSLEFEVILWNPQLVFNIFLIWEHFFKLSSEPLFPRFKLILLLLNFCNFSFISLILLLHRYVLSFFLLRAQTQSLVVSLQTEIFIVQNFKIGVIGLLHLLNFSSL